MKFSFLGVCTAEPKTRMKPLTRCTASVMHGEPADKIEFERELGEGEEGIINFDDLIKRKSFDVSHMKLLENLVENLNERFEEKDIMKAFGKERDAVVDPAKWKDESLLVKQIMSNNCY